LDRRARKAGELATVLIVLAVSAPVLILILKQPDFSTTLTFFPIIIGMLFCAGAEPRHLAAAFGYACVTMSAPLLYTFLQARYPMAAAGSLPFLIQEVSRMGLATAAALLLIALLCALAWRFSMWMRWQIKPVFFIALAAILTSGVISGTLVNRQIKGYQRNRLVAFVAPHSDIQGASYNVHQSQIAIGSGGVWGKGLFAGTQSQLGFLPERHTDFVYAVAGEEIGFLGSLAILGLYLAIIWRIVLAGRAARDRFGYLVCCGMACMLSFNMLVNVGMCLGLMPVVGIPLPLVSYSGSSLVITLWGLGIVGNIYARRYSLL
ncbi:MAG: FtsW/RodA/SpoVE family cell cycle protein, partial [Elusimicrobia bacterium]|nr:FtsW/RodA/SpoVE family cell cycle protein [Elusimicrobiota bacterium]